MPTRLIDVGKRGEPEVPRLIETATAEHYDYIALSHCWGGHVALTTTPETFEQHKEAIPLEDFPLTFRDAVDFTRKMDMKYLWIDSLCIIQGDKSDWEREAAIMGEIFKNSTLTISTTTANNSTKGFLHPRTPRFQPIKVIHSKNTNPLFIRDILLRPWLKSWSQSVEGPDGPLSSRGWILQERLLPPRPLHFGHEQMFWECRTALILEGHPYNPVSLEDGDLYFELGGGTN